MKPKVIRYLALSLVATFAAWLYPVGWFWTFNVAVAATCFWLAGFHYKPAKATDAFMDLECWLEAAYDYLTSRAYQE